MANTKKLIKKETRQKVYSKLSGALAEYKDQVNKKKFENKLKKASKLFAGDIAKAIKKSSKARRAKETGN